MACDNVQKCLDKGGVVDNINQVCLGVDVNGIQGDVELSDMCVLFPDDETTSNGWFNTVWTGVQEFDFGIINSAYCNLYPLLNEGQIPPECRTTPSGVAEYDENEVTTGQKIFRITIAVLVLAIISYIVYRIIKKRK